MEENHIDKLSEYEREQLVKFFKLLIKIDRRHKSGSQSQIGTSDK